MVVERHFSKSIPSLPEELAEEAYDNERNLRKIRGKLKATAEKHFSDSVLRQQQIIRELLPPPGSESFVVIVCCESFVVIVCCESFIVIVCCECR